MLKRWMIYGATGYSGKLICSKVKEYGLNPVIAGRDVTKVIQLAESTQLEYRVFDLKNPDSIDHAIDDMDFVLNIAGPFWDQIKLLVESCIRKKRTSLILLPMKSWKCLTKLQKTMV